MNYNENQFEPISSLLKRCVHGFETDGESVCHYQDVFGHSSIEQLEEAAAGEYREAFWRLYFEAFGAVQTINFYAQHSKYCTGLVEANEELDERASKAEKAAAELKEKLSGEIKEAVERDKSWIEKYDDLESKYEAEKEENENLKQQILELKAKLYDFMTK